MKSMLSTFTVLLMIFAGCGSKQPPADLETGIVSIYVSPDLEVKEGIKNDFYELLASVATIKKVSQPTKVGINILHQDDVEEVGSLGNQDFYFDMNESMALLVSSGHRDSAHRAMYYLLQQLGFEFLWYSDAWTIKPEAIAFSEKKARYVTPEINSIYYGGTGGLNPYNEQQNMARRYQLRNFWRTGDYSPVGHSLSTFYKSKKAEIQALHDRGIIIFHDIDKKRKNLNLDEPKTFDLLESFFLEEIKAKPHLNQFSLAPFDGIGTGGTLPKTIPQITNAGEKQWWWISEVGRRIQQKHPDILLKVNAYGDGKFNAAVPPFSLPSNIMVQLVPDAFQDAYSTRTEMYNAWKQKGEQDGFDLFFYRGYLNITQWSKGGLPQLNQKRHVNQFVDDIKTMDLAGLSLESTHFVIMAPHFYVLSNTLTGYSNKTVDELYNEFYQLAFPKSRNHIEPLFTQWFSGNFNGEYELPEAYKRLHSAYYESDAADDEKARILELIIYLEYLHKYYKAKTAKTIESAVALESFALEVSDYGALQTKAIVFYDYGNVKPYGYRKSPLFKDKTKMQALRNKTLSHKEIENLFLAGKEVYSKTVAPVNFEFDVEKTRPVKQMSTYKMKLYRRGMNFILHTTQAETLKFTIESPKPSFELLITDSKNNEMVRQFSFADVNDKDLIEVPIESHKTYDISFKHALFVSFSTASSVIHQKISPRPGTKWNRYYLYVPKGADEIIYQGKLNDNIKFSYLNDSGNYITVTPKEIYHQTYSIPTQKFNNDGTVKYNARGTVWKINHINEKWDILNFKKVTSPFPFEYRE